MKILMLSEEQQIRNAHSLIIDVFRQCCSGDFSPEGNDCFYQGNSLELFLNGFLKRNILIWGSFLDGELCGVAQIYKPDHFVNLFVDPKYQNLGMGKELFRTVVEYLKKKGVEYLHLESIKSSSQFCKIIGCIPAGETINFHGLEYTPMTYKIQ